MMPLISQPKGRTQHGVFETLSNLKDTQETKNNNIPQNGGPSSVWSFKGHHLCVTQNGAGVIQVLVSVSPYQGAIFGIPC